MEVIDIESVKQFVAEFCSVNIDSLLPTTSLLRDLGIDGDDAAEFMSLFSRRFVVDISEFNFSRHFGPEAGFNPFLGIFRLAIRRGAKQLIPITIVDLAKAVQNKKWKEDT